LKDLASFDLPQEGHLCSRMLLELNSTQMRLAYGPKSGEIRGEVPPGAWHLRLGARRFLLEATGSKRPDD
jgi:hypothetical protein